MTMATFEEIANRPAEEIKPPPLLPVGTYLVMITGQPEQVTSTQKQTPGLAFKYKFYQARDDVDRSDLDRVLGESGRALTDIEMTDTFWITDNSAFMLKQFLTDVLEIPAGGKTLKQMWSEASGCQLLVTIRHRPRTDGSGLFADISGRAKAS